MKFLLLKKKIPRLILISGRLLPILSGGNSSFNFNQITEIFSSPLFLEKVSQKIDIDYFMQIYGSDQILDKSAFLNLGF